MGGVTAYVVKLLCEDSWNGGKGMSLKEVMKMSKDQVFLMLCDFKNVKSEVGNRQTKVNPMTAGDVATTNEGQLKGRAEDGSELRGQIRGESLAKRLAKKEFDPNDESLNDLPASIRDRLMTEHEAKQRRERTREERRKKGIV